MSLGFKCSEETQQTQLYVYEQQPPLKVIRAFPLPAGGALVHLHNISGGVLGGDQLNIAVDVQAGAYAQLTTTSATRLYRSRNGVIPARQTTHIHVAEHGLLEYVPDPLIPFAGARYQQQTRIELARGAGLLWWETVAPGRVARGELFAYDLLQLEYEISVEGRPIALEKIKLEPRQRSLSSLARLGPYHYFTSFYICKVGLDAAYWLSLEKECSLLAQQLTCADEIRWGVSTLAAHGIVVRALSKRGTALAGGLHAFWDMVTQALYGRKSIPPRKIY
ncbi:urease accessory protein UreD [Dictyobacter arantiisoli]|uniref:urease accessory protein UreD n=1 Tax=Dictyobacter arantiisoli TaxID=2014874 RepID=UPI00155ADE8C|nr:urease accessory protein UreD [Dictyobacter arantiisoli]